MLRAEVIDPRTVDFPTSNLVDLSETPWRRIWLSSREPVWTLVDARFHALFGDDVWNVWHDGQKLWQLYAKRNTGPSRATVRLHREIMIAADPRDDEFLARHVVDHINGQTLDNRLENLRWATKGQNNMNRRARGQAPTLDAIVLELLAGLGPRPEKREIPF